jgi:single-strand DNA-binding protein
VFRSLPDGTPVCTFTIATNRYYRKGEGFERETSFIEIEAWGKLAETCTTLAHKGRGCRITGRLKQERWQNSEGKPRSKLIVTAEKIEYKPERHEREEVRNA